MDIVSEDRNRAFDNLEQIDDASPEEEAAAIVSYVEHSHRSYAPFSFWDDKDVYLEAVVEKLSLKSLFSPVCAEFCIPIANGKGWSDMNLRDGMLTRIRRRAAEGKQCIILYCGDHDPGRDSDFGILRKNLSDLLTHAEWLQLMGHLTVDRFGLNYDFIEEQNLTWIDNLETGSGKKPRRSEASGPQGGVRPELHPALRRAEGRGQRPGGPARCRTPALPSMPS